MLSDYINYCNSDNLHYLGEFLLYILIMYSNDGNKVVCLFVCLSLDNEHVKIL